MNVEFETEVKTEMVNEQQFPSLEEEQKGACQCENVHEFDIERGKAAIEPEEGRQNRGNGELIEDEAKCKGGIVGNSSDLAMDKSLVIHHLSAEGSQAR
jgi:hypothetical protein